MERRQFKFVLFIVIFVFIVAIFINYERKPTLTELGWEAHRLDEIMSLFEAYPFLYDKSSKAERNLANIKYANNDIREKSQESNDIFIPLPDDLLDVNGNPILSWRVNLLLALQTIKLGSEYDSSVGFLIKILTTTREKRQNSCLSDIEPFYYANAVDLCSPWNSQSNLTLLEYCPDLFNFDLADTFGKHKRNIHETGTTTVFRIKETHQLLKDNKLVKGKDDDLPYIVFLDSSLRAPWTKPVDDVLLKEIIEGKIKLRDFTSGGRYWYIDCNYDFRSIHPDKFEEKASEWNDILCRCYP